MRSWNSMKKRRTLSRSRLACSCRCDKPRGEVDARIRVAAQEIRDAVDVPLERGEVDADEDAARDAFRACGRARRPAPRRLGHSVRAGHVVLRVLGEVLAVAADRHLVERQPGVARLALVPEHRHAALLEPVEQRVETRIVDHDGAAIGVALLHADVLPDLDRDGALRRMRRRDPRSTPRASRAARCPPRRMSRQRRCGPGRRARSAAASRCCSAIGGKVRVVDVDGQHAEAVRRARAREIRHVAVQVHVHVDLLDARRSPLLGTAGRSALARRRQRRSAQASASARVIGRLLARCSCCSLSGAQRRTSGEPASRARVQRGADRRREPRRAVSNGNGAAVEAGAECVHHRRGVVEHAAAVRHGQGRVRRRAERAVRPRRRSSTSSAAPRVKIGCGLGIARLRGLVHQPRELGERVAAVRPRAVDARSTGTGRSSRPRRSRTRPWSGPRGTRPSLMRENRFMPSRAIQYAEPSSPISSPQPPQRAWRPAYSP